MELSFLALASILIWLSYRSFVGGLEYRRYFKDELARGPSDYAPFVTIFAPYRGLEHGLKQNIEAVITQDYPEFEIIFVVDDRADPAFSEISKFLNDRVKLVVAPRSVGSSQKVENLRTAVLHADPRSKVFVFVDSDVRPSKTWMRNLVGSVEDDRAGAGTGYRWFISQNPTIGSELRSSWNASIASALGRRTESNFCWGGSMAIRRDVFDRLGIRERWRGTLSDDFAVTRAVKEAGLAVVFAPGSLAVSPGDCSVSEMLEFTTRQMKITRVYAPDLWIKSLIGSGLFVAVIIASVLIVVLSERLFLRIAAVLTLILVSALSCAKAWIRLEAVRFSLPGYDPELRAQRWTQCTFWLVTPAIFFYNSVHALVSRRLKWRGTTYKLKSPTETVIILD